MAAPFQIRIRIHSLRLALTIAAAVVVLIAGAVEARKSKRSRTLDEFKTLLKWLLIFIFGPVVIFFLYNIVMDPSFPGLMRELGSRIRNRVAARLGPKRKKKRRQLRQE